MIRTNYNTTPAFFSTPSDWRTWLEKNYKSKTEFWVGFHRADSNKSSITWSQAVEEALCFGWIDGRRRSINKESYCTQFSPRKSKTPWSELTIKKVDTLIQQGRMHMAGLVSFERRKETAIRQGIKN